MGVSISLKESIKKNKLIAIMRNISEDYALSAAQALYDGGVRLVEVTFNQAAADSGITSTYRAIQSIKYACPDDMYVGAGTVLTEPQMRIAINAGAEYIVSPNIEPELIKIQKKLGLVSIPGALTPTEIVLAHSSGADFVKIFPADIMGLSYAKAIMAPLNHIPMIAVGGVNLENLTSFLEAGFCGVGIGGNILKQEFLLEKDFDAISKTAKKYTDIIEQYNANNK